MQPNNSRTVSYFSNGKDKQHSADQMVIWTCKEDSIIVIFACVMVFFHARLWTMHFRCRRCSVEFRRPSVTSRHWPLTWVPCRSVSPLHRKAPLLQYRSLAARLSGIVFNHCSKTWVLHHECCTRVMQSDNANHVYCSVGFHHFIVGTQLQTQKSTLVINYISWKNKRCVVFIMWTYMIAV